MKEENLIPNGVVHGEKYAGAEYSMDWKLHAQMKDYKELIIVEQGKYLLSYFDSV